MSGFFGTIHASPVRLFLKPLSVILAIVCISKNVPAAEPVARSAGAISAQWIWSAEAGPADSWMCFRTTAELDDLPKSLPARIAADSTYWLWINGAPVVVAGGLKRGPTPADSYCDVVDLAPCLKNGRNTVTALVWFWGLDGSSHINSGKGGFFLETAVPDFCTGPQWRIQPHTAFKKGRHRPPLGVRPESPILFDARDDIGNWQASGFDDSRWAAATAKGAPPAEPWGRLVARPIPFFRTSEPRDYQNDAELHQLRENTADAELVARLPANLQIYPRLTVSAKGGLKITIQPEHSYEAATYITRDGDQTFEVPAWSNGHFVTYHIPESVRVIKLDYRETGYDTDLAGEFHSSDRALDILWGKCARSACVNLRDSYMDCPDRERSPWPGDMVNVSAAASFVFDRRVDAITAKALREFLNWQAPNGVLWGAVPSGRFRGTYREFPAQSLALIAVGFPNYVRQTADRGLAAEAVPRIRRYLMECWSMAADGLPVTRPYKAGWSAGTVDWMDWGNQVDRQLLETSWYAWALAGLESLTQAAGLPSDGETAARRRSIAEAFDRTFWDEAVHAYRTPGSKQTPDDRGNAVAICAGLVPEKRHADLVRFLSQREVSSIYMERYAVDALFILKSPDAALARLKRRYAEAIAAPATTLPEEFHTKGLQTNHGWGAWPAATMARYIAGVSPLTDGYGKFRVEPSPAGLTRFDLRFPSAHGLIGVRWETSAKARSLDVTCPQGSTAEIIFPSDRDGAKTISLTCNGIRVWPKAATGCPVEIVAAGIMESMPRFRVAAGRWSFVATAE